jgi:transposase
MLSYRFRLYPSKTAERTLNRHMGLCCWLYNRLLSELSIARRVDGAGTPEKKRLWGWTPIGTPLQLWPLGRFRR